MTREEAIKIWLPIISDGIKTMPELKEAFEMAIKALEQEPCEDVISRQYLLDNCVVDKVTMPYVPANKIKNAPPVQPQPKTGHWIIEKWNNKEHYSCSSCQHVVEYEPCYHYCPYCGAKMEVSG